MYAHMEALECAVKYVIGRGLRYKPVDRAFAEVGTLRHLIMALAF